MRIDEMAIPIAMARLCLNCDCIIQASVCPVCQSRQQLFVAQFLGSLKTPDLKRFVIENGKVKAIKIEVTNENH